MAPPPKNPNLCTYRCLLCFLLLVSSTTLSAALATSYSSLCSSPSPAADKHTDVEDAHSLIRSFQISTGYFTGGGGGLFSPDDDDPYYTRSVSLFPHGVSRTSDPNVLHLTATLTLKGLRDSSTFGGSFSRRRSFISSIQSVSFVLDGYYSSASLELCMVGAGTELADDGSLKHYAGVALRLRVPSPPKLTDPFVTGRLDVSDFKAGINLVAYAEGDSYKYGERVPVCSQPTPPAGTARGSLQALGANFSCPHLSQQLTSSYRLEHGGGADTPSRMDVNQMHCTADGAVRAYVVFSNNITEESRYQYRRHELSRMLVDDDAVVAEGNWDSTQSMLCLRACRVLRPRPHTPAVQHECGIQMRFWFPAVWTMRDRSVAAGMVWSSRQGSTGSGSNDGGLVSGAMSARSIDIYNDIGISIVDSYSYRSNLSDVKYSYNHTVNEEAKKHYLKIKKHHKMMKGSSFLAPGNLTYHDLEFRFFGHGHAYPRFRFFGHGHAYPIAVGTAMVHGDKLDADESLSRHAVVDMVKDDLLNVSYDVDYNVPPDNRNGSGSYTTKTQRISAEGVYDPTRGILSMIGCWERNSSSPADCQILLAVQLPSLDGTTQGRGAISSLRERADALFFERVGIYLYGKHSTQMSEAVSRMDLESILLVVSTTLSCVFTAVQILHAKKNPEAAAATSITMLGILVSGHLASLVLSSEALFASRMQYYGLLSLGNHWAWLELNTMIVRVPTLIAFVLHLRLLQLAWSGRRSADQSKPAAAAAAERRVLQICVPLYVLGGVLAGIVHAVHARAEAESPLVIIPAGGETATAAATLWEDIVSYLGLVLDGFLLPQIVLNAAASGSTTRVRAISPWFYVGGTLLRAVPHAYDVIRARGYVVQSIRPSYIYASHRGDLFGVAWNAVTPCAVAVLALLLFMQQRLRPERKRSGGYEMVPGL